MPRGTVKWFDLEKGYGFIQQSEGRDDLFVHHSQTDGSALSEGDAVDYEIGEGPKGPCATKVSKGQPAQSRRVHLIALPSRGKHHYLWRSFGFSFFVFAAVLAMFFVPDYWHLLFASISAHWPVVPYYPAAGSEASAQRYRRSLVQVDASVVEG